MVKGLMYHISILASITAPVFGALAQNITIDDVQKAEEQALERKMAYKKLQAQSVQLSVELAKMNNLLISQAQKIQSDEEKISKTEEELQLLQNKYALTQENFNQEYQNLAQVLASMQNLALHPSGSLLLQPLTPVEIIQSAVLMRESVPYIEKNAEKIKTDLEELNKQKTAVEQKLKTLLAQNQALKKKQTDIKSLAEQKSRLQKQVEGEKQKTQAEVEKLVSQASDLRDLMEKIEQEEDLKRRKKEERQKALKERQEAQRKLEEEQLSRIRAGKSEGFEGQTGFESQEPEPDISYTTVQSSNKAQKSLKSAGGQFALPARGQIVTQYGEELEKGVTSKGIIIKARPNAQVIAPYDGSVVFSGPFKGYGNLVIINHEDGFISLLAGMHTTDVETGQMVLLGEPVGNLPDTQNTKLYMEIRKDKKPINPLPWLGK